MSEGQEIKTLLTFKLEHGQKLWPGIGKYWPLIDSSINSTLIVKLVIQCNCTLTEKWYKIIHRILVEESSVYSLDASNFFKQC